MSRDQTDAEQALQLIENGKFDEAKQIADRLLQQATSRPNADALWSLGMSFENQYHYADAEPLYKRSLEIYKEKLRKDDHDMADALNNFGVFYEKQFRYTEAEPLFKQALEIREKQRNIYTVQTLNALAVLYKNQGRYAEAEPLYKQALEILKDPNDTNRAVLLRNLARVYKDQGRYTDAEQYYKESLKIYERKLAKDAPDIAPPLYNLALLYQDQGRYNEAEPLQKRALAIDEKHYGKDHPETAASYNSLANLYCAQDRYTEAGPLYKQSLEIYEKKLGKDHPQTADTLCDMAMFYYTRQKRYNEAEPLYDHAIAIYEKTPTMAAHLGQMWYQSRAIMYKETDRQDKAIADLKQAMDLSSDVRKHASGSDEQRAETFAQYYNLFERMVDWQHELGNMNEVYEAMERSRAQGLLDLINSSGINLLAGLPEGTAQKLGTEETTARSAVTLLENQLNMLPQRTGMTAVQKKAEEEKLMVNLKNAKKRLVDAMAAIRSASPAYRQMIAEDRKPVALETVRKEFDATKTLALEYLIGKEKSYVLVYGFDVEPILLPLELNDGQAKLFNIGAGSLTSKKLETILQNDKDDGMLQLVGNREHVDSALPAKETLEKLEVLWRLLVPNELIREKILNGKSFAKLLILPDGALARLPFEMLIVEPVVVNPRYLLDNGPTVVYAPSASMYYNLSNRNIETNTAQTLTVGNPDYTVKRIVKASDPLTDMLSTRRAARMGMLAPLPWTEKEAAWIEDSCRKNNIPVIRLDRLQATEENIRKHMPGSKIVHLACHGLAEDDPGSAIFSTLAVTIGDPNDPKNDGFLDLAEMFSLDLKSCELAVLSACDTNRGPNQHGEGTWSMGRGMLASGARRVVTTDWQVEDDASAQLVSWFIDTVNQANAPDYAEALREAKRSIRSNLANPAWQHPYYWAPFVLIGTN